MKIALRDISVFRVSFASLLTLLLVSITSCDTAPGIDSAGIIPPVVSEFSFTPAEIALDALPPSQVNGNEVSIPMELNVVVRDQDQSPIERVNFAVLTPGSTPEIILEGVLQTPGAGRYEANPTLILDAGAVGRYSIKIWAFDRDGNLSNQVIGTFVFRAEGNPPVLESVEAPATVVRPSSGQPATRFSIVATVTDPDGLGNIQRVVLRTQGGAELLMRDDGGEGSISGDVTAGDGKYTITVEVSSTNALGPNTFTFQAFDRGGLASNTIEKTITIVE